MLRLLHLFLFFFFVMGTSIVGNAYGQVSREVFERIAPAVAQVRARNCSGGEDRSGTGFLFGNSDQLVTALHVVVGCEKIDAYFERGNGRTILASVERVLERADLALLLLQQSAGEPLVASSSEPRANDELSVLAFFLATPTLDNKSLSVTFGSTRLSGMLPPDLRSSLADSQAIDLDLNIVRLDGHLLPGSSGAPLVNQQGRVVAIGSGGLLSGAASISWALPSVHLASLLESQTQYSRLSARNSGLFSTPLPDQSDILEARRILCGDLTFVHLGSRSFAELAATSDDPIGLQQLLAHSQHFGLTPGAEDGFLFDIYVPEERGGVVVVPSWMQEPSGEGVCRAREPNGSLEIAFGGKIIRNPWELEPLSHQLNLALLRHPNWFIDPSFSYMAPNQRPDGLIVRRRMLNRQTYSPPYAQLAFSTLAAKGDQIFGVVMINHGHNGQGYAYCAQPIAPPGCNQLKNELERLSQLILSVHLSTFPIY